MGLFWRAGAGGVFPGEAARHGGEAGDPVLGRIHARGGLGQIQRDPHRPHRRHAQPLRQARPGAAPFRIPLKATKSLEIDPGLWRPVQEQLVTCEVHRVHLPPSPMGS